MVSTIWPALDADRPTMVILIMGSFFWLALLGLSILSNSRSQNNIFRDGTLKGLESLLKSPKIQELFANWKNDNENDYYDLISALTPWIVAPPKYPLVISHRPYFLDKNSIDCGETKYSQVLSGQKLDQERFIIDLVPFGYDIDTLELRLYETYDIVDVFIIYEAPRTQSAHQKPLFYSMIRNTSRFQSWNDKIIYFAADDKNLQSFATRTRNGPRSGPLFLRERFALEKSMRSEPIRLFKDLPETHILKQLILKSLNNAWIIQNDGDELPNGDALAHFKYCKLKSDTINEVYFPSFPFKKNYNWIQNTKDLGCMEGGNINSKTEYLRFHTWRPGPYVQRFSEVLNDGETRRHRKSDSITPCSHHMGLGAGTHLSSIAEPVAYLLKRYSVIEQNHRGSLTQSLISNGMKGTITPSILYRETLFPWCETVHISSLATMEGRELVWTSLPWIVRFNPWRYPFMLPTVLYSNLLNDLSFMIKNKVISYNVIQQWNDTIHQSRRYDSSYGNIVVFGSVGIIEETGLPSWRNNARCTDNW